VKAQNLKCTMLPILDNIGTQKVCESAMLLEVGVAGIIKLYPFNWKYNFWMKQENTNT